MIRACKLLSLMLVLITCSAYAQTVEQATNWLRHLYGQYENPPTPRGTDILATHPLQVYTRGLYALVRRDQLRAGPGNVGNLDIDPICICQDNGGMKLQHIDVTQTGLHSATAKVTLYFPEPRTIHAQLFLLWTPNGWRVDEVKADDMPSLRKLLR